MGYLKDKLLLNESTVEPKPFTLESMIAWMETFPTDQTYCWADSGECLFARYGAAMGVRDFGGGESYLVAVERMLEHYGNPNIGEPFHLASGYPRTFGGALQRAREALNGL